MTNLINLSFSTGLFSKIFKQAKIIPIFKKGDHEDCNNYKSISLLSYISKIVENKFLYTNEFSFCNLHSTNHALVTITEKIKKFNDNGKIKCGIFVNLKKAFDTVDHKIFHSELEHYGIRGVPLK